VAIVDQEKLILIVVSQDLLIPLLACLLTVARGGFQIEDNCLRMLPLILLIVTPP